MNKKNIFIFTVLLIGLSGIVAQVIILRELLVSFNGNELTLGIILANWVICEAFGAFIIGRLMDKTQKHIDIFIILEIIFCISLPIAIYLARVFKPFLGIPFGEVTGIGIVLIASGFITLLSSFSHGGLLSSSVKLHSVYIKGQTHSIGKVYTWETAGTILGSIILTYIFIPYFNSFQVSAMVAVCNSIVLFLLFYSRKVILSCFLLFYILLSLFSTPLQKESLHKQWQKAGRVLDYRNSVYGNIVATQNKEQYTFFYNGLPAITVPYPDITFIEEFSHVPLLFHPFPKDILIIGSGAGGLINEIEKHLVRQIDYAQQDPAVIKMLKDYPVDLTIAELSDTRLKVVNTDGRFYLRNSSDLYDVILIGMSWPSDLATNRFFTQEFFALCRNRLRPDGILSLWLPASLTYLSNELKDLNACVLNALKNTHAYIRIIPGDYNIFLASDSKGIVDTSIETVVQRIRARAIPTRLLTPSYLEYRLHKRWTDWFEKSFVKVTSKVNRDLWPYAVFEMLTYWNKQFYIKFIWIMEGLKYIDLKLLVFIISIFTAVFYYYLRPKENITGLPLIYSIATTGFFGMMMDLILIFTFQVFYGYLYQKIGLLIGIFMCGIALGSAYITANMDRLANKHKRLFIGIEIMILSFSIVLAYVLNSWADMLQRIPLIFILIFFIPGFLMGLEFPLASRIHSQRREENLGRTIGVFYFADLMGGWVAGMVGGVVLLPILGVFNTCIFIAVLKLSSIIILLMLGFKVVEDV